MALLSIFEEVNASARITPSSGPYLRPDGTILAANAAALFRPRLQSITHDLLSLEELIVAPEFDETGSIVVADETWTGSEDDGTAFGDSDSDCIGWTSVDGAKLGRTGLQDRVDSLWLSGANRFCDDENHLYCLQR